MGRIKVLEGVAKELTAIIKGESEETEEFKMRLSRALNYPPCCKCPKCGLLINLKGKRQ